MKTATPETAVRSRILIVDDHAVVRHGVAQIIGEEPDLVVCGQAEDAHGGLELVGQLQPDLIIADLSLKGRPGIELIKDLQVQHPKVPVLVLSMHDEALWAERALRAGARGYVMKHEPPEHLIRAIRRVLAGEISVSEKLAASMVHKLVRGKSAAPVDSPLHALTDREMEIFQMLGSGQAVREIAEKLNLSVKTVDAHREHIKEKLNLKSSTELLRYAIVTTLQGE